MHVFRRKKTKINVSKLEYYYFISSMFILVGSRNGFERDLHKQISLVSQSN